MAGVAPPSVRPAPVDVAIAIGSNLGDRRAHIGWAIDQLRTLIADLRTSAVIETPPVDVPTPQPDYLNAVVVGQTRLTARALLQALQDLELQRGRDRRGVRAARTLDLDLILYGREVIDEAGLQVPHPRFRGRGFVLGPLVELAAGWIDPVTGKSIEELAGK